MDSKTAIAKKMGFPEVIMPGQILSRISILSFGVHVFGFKTIDQTQYH